MAQRRSDTAPALQREKVWDPVTRVWHWLLAATVITGWLLGEFRNFDTIEWHMYLGYTVGVLLVFRLLWGLVGPQPIRLRSLVPATSLHHLSSKIVLLLVVLHVGAILYYLLWKRENLVVAMITGWKWVRRD